MKAVLAVALAVLVVSGSALAAISVGTSAPTGPLVVISQPSVSRGVDTFHHSSTNYRAWGQTFRLNAGELPFTLDKVTMILKPGPNYGMIEGAQMRAKFITVVDDNTNQVTSTIYNWTNVGAMSGLVGADTLHYVTFDIPNVNITAGTQYAWLVDFVNDSAYTTDGSGQVYGWMQTGDSYARGDSRDINGMDPTANPAVWGSGGDDMGFYITAIPEPATMGLLAVGGIFGLLRRRK